VSILSMGTNPAFKPAPPPVKLDYSKLPKTGREDMNRYDGTQIAKPYSQQVEEFSQRAENTAYSGAFLRCEVHQMGKVVFACDHCEHQDEVHPDGMIFTPYRYFICNKCYAKHQLMSLNFQYELKTRCWNCILDECMRLKNIDPKLVRDWSDKPHRGLY
jgi:hypothetical protein